MDTLPSFDYERQYWGEGIKMVAGIDEVGMGALAGPVVAAAVIVKKSKPEIQNGVVIRDSKTMSAKQREVAADWVKQHALVWATGEASVEEIDELNIRQASHLAMKRAVDALGVTPELLLVDGRPVQLHAKIPTVNIINGDSLCFSIAAASIVAKVHRDELMELLAEKIPEYGWASNKGYGSLKHRLMLQERGVTKYHRKSYAPVAKLT